MTAAPNLKITLTKQLLSEFARTITRADRVTKIHHAKKFLKKTKVARTKLIISGYTC